MVHWYLAYACLSYCVHSASPTNAWSVWQALGFPQFFWWNRKRHVWCAWASISYSIHCLDWWVEVKCATKACLPFSFHCFLEACSFFRKTFPCCNVKWDRCLMNKKTNEMEKNTVYQNFPSHNISFRLNLHNCFSQSVQWCKAYLRQILKYSHICRNP